MMMIHELGKKHMHFVQKVNPMFPTPSIAHASVVRKKLVTIFERP